jgi:hypothetical protein
MEAVMTKGIQAMKQFKRERTMMELTAATASYHQLSGTRMVSGRMMTIPDKYSPVSSKANLPHKKTREYWRPTVGFPLPIVAAGIADAPWRAGAVWGS